MEGKWLTPIVLLSFFLFSGTLFSPSPASADPSANGGRDEPATPGGGNTTADCLECHGPFEKLASAPPSFVTEKGEKVTPHRYVPHDQKEIPDCVNCHQPHSATPSAAEIAALPKPNVRFCFDCHHKENFTPCKSCHQ